MMHADIQILQHASELVSQAKPFLSIMIAVHRPVIPVWMYKEKGVAMHDISAHAALTMLCFV